MKDPSITDGSTVIPGICQLLLTLHSGLLPSSQTPDTADQRGQKGVEVEPAGGKSLPGTETAIHNGTDTSPLRRHKTRDYRNGCLRLCNRGYFIAGRQQRDATPCGLPLVEVAAGGNQL